MKITLKAVDYWLNVTQITFEACPSFEEVELNEQSRRWCYGDEIESFR